MKCVKYEWGQVEKVSNELAEKLVSEGKAIYCPKSELKKQQKKKS